MASPSANRSCCWLTRLASALRTSLCGSPAVSVARSRSRAATSSVRLRGRRSGCSSRRCDRPRRSPVSSCPGQDRPKGRQPDAGRATTRLRLGNRSAQGVGDQTQFSCRTRGALNSVNGIGGVSRPGGSAGIGSGLCGGDVRHRARQSCGASVTRVAAGRPVPPVGSSPVARPSD